MWVKNGETHNAKLNISSWRFWREWKSSSRRNCEYWPSFGDDDGDDVECLVLELTWLSAVKCISVFQFEDRVPNQVALREFRSKIGLRTIVNSEPLFPNIRDIKVVFSYWYTVSANITYTLLIYIYILDKMQKVAINQDAAPVRKPLRKTHARTCACS